MSGGRKLSARALLAVAALVLGAGFQQAEMQMPEQLVAEAEAWEVTGHNPRTWNKPIGFGPFQSSTVREGSEFSWSIELFGVRGGSAKRRYRLVLAELEGEALEVECRSRSIEAWREGWSVELTDAFAARLACGVHASEAGSTAQLVLGSDGKLLQGALQDAGTGARLFELRSIHRLNGSKLPLAEPAGYLLERSGSPIAAVETINRGRVRLHQELDAPTRAQAAAVVAALLLYRPELSPQD